MAGVTKVEKVAPSGSGVINKEFGGLVEKNILEENNKKNWIFGKS